VRVIALKLGFYDGSRRRVGDVFDWDVSTLQKDKDGEPVLPFWVKAVPANEAAASAEATKAAKAELEQKALGAVAASGEGASNGAVKRKLDAISALVFK